MNRFFIVNVLWTQKWLSLTLNATLFIPTITLVTSEHKVIPRILFRSFTGFITFIIISRCCEHCPHAYECFILCMFQLITFGRKTCVHIFTLIIQSRVQLLCVLNYHNYFSCRTPSMSQFPIGSWNVVVRTGKRSVQTTNKHSCNGILSLKPLFIFKIPSLKLTLISLFSHLPVSVFIPFYNCL